MGMSALSRIWTREEVLALPDDGRRYELVDGELLVSPTPRPLHQLGVMALFELLAPYARRLRLGPVIPLPADLDLRSGQLLQPDLFVVDPHDTTHPLDWSEIGIPLLVVEVLSASTARFDRLTKRYRYQRSGVPTYWIVDLDARLVEVWTPEADRPIIAAEQLGWQPIPEIEPLEIDLVAYFGEVWGEKTR